MKRDRHRCRQRPRGSRPDDGRNFLSRERSVELRRIIQQPVLYPHRRTGVVLVLDLGFGERGLVVHAPVHGAQALVDEVIFVEREEGLQHHRFVLVVHRGVGFFKAAENPNPLKLLPLKVQKLLGVLTALRPHIRGPHLQFFATQFLVDLDFDGQPVAVPARHVGSVKPRHGLGLDHEVLQALVHGGAQMDRAAGVGRPVVQNVGRCPLPGLPDAVVNPLLLPPSQHFGFVLRQARLHGEVSLGQVDAGFKVDRHRQLSPK